MGRRRWSTRWRVAGLRWPYHRLHQQTLLGWPAVERQGCWSMLASGDSAANGFGSRSLSRVAIDLARPGCAACERLDHGEIVLAADACTIASKKSIPCRCCRASPAPVLLLSGDNSPIASAQHAPGWQCAGCDAASSSPMILSDDSPTSAPDAHAPSPSPR